MELKEIKDTKEILGAGIMFRCGACGCGFFQDARDIQAYESGLKIYPYILRTSCPNCKGSISVKFDGMRV